MSDNKNINEEYQYVEDTDIEPSLSESAEPLDTGGDAPVGKDYSDKLNALMGQSHIRRNAVIAVVALFVLIFLIKCMGPSINKQNDVSSPNIPYQEQINKQQPNNNAPQASIDNSQMNDILATQNNLKNTMSQLNDQVMQLNNQLGVISNNYQTLQQEFLTTQNKLNVTVQAVKELIASGKAKPVSRAKNTSPHPYTRSTPVYHLTYFVQAIIPGRAWLINTNGETLTVMVGSKILGYGSVTKIHAQEGRVFTSSGKVLKFNQEY